MRHSKQAIILLLKSIPLRGTLPSTILIIPYMEFLTMLLKALSVIVTLCQGVDDRAPFLPTLEPEVLPPSASRLFGMSLHGTSTICSNCRKIAMALIAVRRRFLNANLDYNNASGVSVRPSELRPPV